MAPKAKSARRLNRQISLKISKFTHERPRNIRNYMRVSVLKPILLANKWHIAIRPYRFFKMLRNSSALTKLVIVLSLAMVPSLLINTMVGKPTIPYLLHSRLVSGSLVFVQSILMFTNFFSSLMTSGSAYVIFSNSIQAAHHDAQKSIIDGFPSILACFSPSSSLATQLIFS